MKLAFGIIMFLSVLAVAIWYEIQMAKIFVDQLKKEEEKEKEKKKKKQA